MAEGINVGSVSVSIVPSAEGFADALRERLLGDADVIGGEVGDILRAKIDEKLADVKLKVGVDDALAALRLDEIRAKTDELNGKKAEVQVQVNNDNGAGVRSWLVSLIAGAVAIAPAFVVAAAGIGIFAAFAAPQIAGVTKYIDELATGSAKAGAQWQSLSADQKTAASDVLQLKAEFHDLSNSISPQILMVFQSVLEDINRILPEVTPVAKAAAIALGSLFDQLGNGLTDSRAQQFFAFIAQNIGPDLNLIGGVTVQLIHAFFSLTEAMQPMSIGLLHVVGIFADLLSGISNVAPWLADIIVLSIALYKPLNALKDLQLLNAFSWIGPAITGIKDFTVAAEGASLAEKGLVATELAAEAISPLGWVAIGAVAVGGLIFALSRLHETTVAYIGDLAKQDQASGFNIAGYQNLANQLDGARGKTIALQIADQNAAPASSRFSDSQANLSGALGVVSERAQEAQDKANNLSSSLAILEGKFNVSQVGAEQLAKAAHVTAAELAAGGKESADAILKIEAYAKANEAARTPLQQFNQALQQESDNALGAANQIKGLTTAYNDMINPNLNAEQAVVNLKNDLGPLATALQKSSGFIGDQTQAQRDSFGAFDTYVNQINATEQATLNASGAQREHDRNILENSIPTLEKIAAKNKSLRGEIDALIGTIRAIPKTEQIGIDVTGRGRFSIQEQLIHGGINAPGLGNTRITAQGGLLEGGIPGVDSIPIMAMPGEAVVPVHVVPFVAETLKKAGVPGFDTGGLVGSFSTSNPAALGTWTAGEVQSGAQLLTQSVADAIKAAFSGIASSLSASGGGGGSLPGGGLTASGSSAAQAQAIAKSLLPLFGWSVASQFPYLQELWNRESGWQWNATNPSSGAYGIPQSLPADKMAAAGADWRTDPATQERWGLGYIKGRYGSPAEAMNHELQFNWYDNGGWVPPGASVMFNGTGQPEPVLSGQQWSMLQNAVSRGGGNATSYNAYFTMDSAMFESRVRGAFRAMDMESAMRERIGRPS